MRALLFAPSLVVALVALVVVACGGSASETPWPVEPEAVQYAPPGENMTPSLVTEERADGGRPKKP
jgi:hypothetical protein